MAYSQQFRVTKSGSRTASKEEAKERLKYTVKAYKEAEGSLPITQAAKLIENYVVSKDKQSPGSGIVRLFEIEVNN